MQSKTGIWFPTVFPDRCDGCAKYEAPRCIKFCQNEVFELKDGKVLAVKPYNCVYGCSACEPVCPKKAIIFPMKETISTQTQHKDKELLHKITCGMCGKIFFTNREADVCMDCESKR